MRSYSLFIIATILFTASLLTWISFSRLNDFQRHHTEIAHESVNGVSNEISRFIDERKQLIRAFTQEHQPLLQRLINNPENETTHALIQQKITAYFPHHFAFTLTDHSGKPYIDHFDGRIGEICLEDIRAFTVSNKYLQRIHPNSEAYHFDLMEPLFDKNNSDILFISFHADILGRILKNAQQPGHNLLLVYPDKQNLLEVTDKGARNKITRLDYHLSTEEAARILFQRDIPDTAWMVADLHDPELLSSFRLNLLLQYGLIFLVISIASILVLLRLHREEQHRKIAERSKDDFLSVVSHELRTPLTSIRGALGLLSAGEAGTLPEKSREMIAIAETNSEQLLSIVNDLLDFRQLETGKIQFNFSPHSIDEVVTETIQSIQNYAEPFGVSFNYKNLAGDLTLNIDKSRIKQVMFNLLSNAIKYGREKDTIQITVQQIDTVARITVTDHGPGIPDSFHNKLFERFTQLDTTNTRKIRGTGLGLSIVKAIIEGHHGHVDFVSSKNTGTSFYFELPVN